MKIHLTAIGGSIMHNLAIALHKKGYEVQGSDDAIYEPARSRLEKYGLLPSPGWHPEKLDKSIDMLILGMHAKAGNPELDRALQLGLPVVSFPQFIYEQSKNKQRIVIAGSHGKTSVTAMVMHVLRKAGLDFDYAVGSVIEGFEDSVRLSEDAPVIVIEGDEYLTSALDRRPKFVWYDPQIALINGIAWDHINVFPTYEMYLEQFRNFIRDMKAGAKLIYHPTDQEVSGLVKEVGSHLQPIPASVPQSELAQDGISVLYKGKAYPLRVFGRHNLENLSAAQAICVQLGVSAEEFWEYASDFKGAGKRLESVPNKKNISVFRDFAHAPSKVKASVQAVRSRYPDKKILAVLELHTFSSLNKDFIPFYAASLDPADKAVIYLDNEALRAKGVEGYSEEQLRSAFAREDLQLTGKAEMLEQIIGDYISPDAVLLLMSSGDLGGIDIKAILNREG
jgi:UDP-N-acetylmuramate: L-alanyl-gamma-D-glutamyl-meso-diaminopimelate ligase